MEAGKMLTEQIKTEIRGVFEGTGWFKGTYSL